MMFTTRLKKENQALREELSLFEQVRASLDGEMLALSLDPQGRIESVNANFEKEMHYRAEQLRGRPLLELIPEKVRNLDFHHKVRHALEHGEHLSGVIRLLRGNGEDAWLRSILQPIRDSTGQIQSFYIYASDLTRTIETSREYENLVKALQRSTAVIEFNLNGDIITANKPFLDAMGYNLAQIQGKHHRIFCEPAETSSAQYQRFWEQLRRGDFVTGRFKRVDSSGRDVWLEASYNPVTDTHGQLYKVVKFASVITEQVNREDAVAEAAGIAFETSKGTDTSAKNGAAVVQQMLEAMRELSSRMQEAAQGIEALDKQSQLIGAIVKNISSIADQTNLLALNAAIEAARAVELIGRGKTQAELGLDLCAQAGQVIEEIQDGAKHVVSAVERFATQL